MYTQDIRSTQIERAKSKWIQPEITIIPLASAEGAVAGPLCDKRGSLSRGTGCPT